MGRPLKIQKYSTNTGINSPGAAVPIDQGFPNFGSLTDPVYNSPVQTLNADQFLGVVGGASSTATSTTFPRIKVIVNIALAAGGGQGVNTTGYIIRQKGNHKYLVASSTSVADEDIVVGNAYRITSVGTTDWSLFGANATYGVGDIFTATANGSNSGNGTCNLVGVCILDNDATPAAGYMAIGYESADSAVAYASNLTNKWVRDWIGTTNGYSDANLGEVDYSSEAFYVTNFFTDEGTVTWSGAEIINGAYAQNGTIPLAVIDNVTS